MNQGLRRRLATGVNAILVTCFLVAAVFLVVDMGHRYHYRFDFSQDATGTLSQDTREVLALLESSGRTMEVVAFSSQGRNSEGRFRDQLMKDFLRELRIAAPQLETQFVNLDRERALTEKYGVNAYGTVVVRDGNDRVDIKARDVYKRRGGSNASTPDVDFRGEALIMRAIAQVIAGEKKTVYVLEGHGELSVGQQSSGQLSKWVELMERQGWFVKPLALLSLDLAGPPAVPDDADSVMIINPKYNQAPAETTAIKAFIGRGGGVGLFLESNSALPSWLEELGIQPRQGSVRDTPTVWPHPDWPVMRYGSHVITQELIADKISTVIGGGSALEVLTVDGVTSLSILRTSHRGWLELGEEQPAVFTEGEDVRGPLDVGVLLQVTSRHPMVEKGRIGRVVVFGDSNLVTDEMMEHLGNPSFAVNVARWLVGDDGGMTLVGRVGRVRYVAIEQTTLNRIGWFVMGIYPLCIVLIGFFVRWTRRQR